MEDSLNPQDVERARSFWSCEDVDQLFDGVSEYVDHLRKVLKTDTATDREYVQGLKLLHSLDFCPSSQDSSVVQVVIGSGELLLPELSPARSHDDLLPPLTPEQLQYKPHQCCKACLPALPSMHQSPFWNVNPLKVPLLCGFKRLSASPLMMSSPLGEGEGPGGAVDQWDVVYKAPCGKSLRNHDDVMLFLLATDSYDILQVDLFTFNPRVRLDPPPLALPWRPETDLSRGVEPTAVDLCVGRDGVRPSEFRYRKERWPPGCFLSQGALFSVCCDCTDGCDAARCQCVRATTRGQHYTHHRLEAGTEEGLYECGPWCGCDRSRCQNRLVQRGIRVRLQVFQTEDRGWGVRCRDDIDSGTFICIYAGVILRRVLVPVDAPPPKLTRNELTQNKLTTRNELTSDDEVEVVTEWLVPPATQTNITSSQSQNAMTSPHLVPVIQRPLDTNHNNNTAGSVGSGDQSPANQDAAEDETETKKKTKSLKRTIAVDDINFLDASKEGNVARFINHSCQPNLFIQNVFTDSHDPAFPVIAFFTRGVVKAGSELTWDYSSDANAKREVACLCRSNGCRERFTVETECQVGEQ